ncbi:hypothetical protein JCM17478_21350 [Thermopirellula anaerolimosa]
MVNGRPNGYTIAISMRLSAANAEERGAKEARPARRTIRPDGRSRRTWCMDGGVGDRTDSSA